MRKLFFGVLFLPLVSSSCKEKVYEYKKVSGFAQGTTYHITYENLTGKDYLVAFDSILKAFDKSLSIYEYTSIISRINNNQPNVLVDNWFVDVFNKSKEINQLSDGAFDITVGPVARVWGFGNAPVAKHDKNHIDSLLQFVGMEKVRLEGRYILKSNAGVKLDANALAQGYSVDVVCAFLEKEGIQNYLVEIGGELKAKGLKNNGEKWRIGIDRPEEESVIQALMEVTDKAVATSGNYRKFYEENGVKYSHIINPKTGFPARNTLLSATVVANTCIDADALATTFMVLGLDKSKDLITKIKGIDVYFIYSNNRGEYETYATEGFKKMMVDSQNDEIDVQK